MNQTRQRQFAIFVVCRGKKHRSLHQFEGTRNQANFTNYRAGQDDCISNISTFWLPLFHPLAFVSANPCWFLLTCTRQNKVSYTAALSASWPWNHFGECTAVIISPVKSLKLPQGGQGRTVRSLQLSSVLGHSRCSLLLHLRCHKDQYLWEWSLSLPLWVSLQEIKGLRPLPTPEAEDGWKLWYRRESTSSSGGFDVKTQKIPWVSSLPCLFLLKLAETGFALAPGVFFLVSCSWN